MITNTTKSENHPEWTMGGNPNAIEAQEARGQQEFVNSTQLPTDVNTEDKKLLEDAGVVFGEPVKGDEMFCDANLPEGWKKQPTDHSMWSLLVDGDGKERAKIFYKAAFYDRHATIYATKEKAS